MVAEISRLLARPKSDSIAAAALAAAVHVRFGRKAFATNVQAAILRLFPRQPAQVPKSEMTRPVPEDWRANVAVAQNILGVKDG